MIMILFVYWKYFLIGLLSKRDERVNITGYNLLRSSHPSNKKRGSVYMYYEEHVPIIESDDLRNLEEMFSSGNYSE